MYDIARLYTIHIWYLRDATTVTLVTYNEILFWKILYQFIQWGVQTHYVVDALFLNITLIFALV